MKKYLIVCIFITTTFASCAQTHSNKKTMNNTFKTEFISTEKNAKTLLLLGGNVERRHEIITLLQPLKNVSVHGALSEEEGIQMLQTLACVDVVLIGGRYSVEQRIRIRELIHSQYSHIKITEPGVDYMYSNENILQNILLLLQ